ncbi:S1 RNA-binding domain-containing protein [Patescibacteria group bacterium]|nr:S1 RNA-binding domain-containing protein [Patescibacteria group bacterium]MBU1921759.1 S1 RNA-binding domain-containing protein [Patescibacteria group bacterium]
MATKIKEKEESEFQKLVADKQFLDIPKVGDVIKGEVISASKREVKIDIPGYSAGVIRGRELFNESAEYAKLKPGDEVEATVVDIENENGEMELSFRYAGHRRAWGNIAKLYDSKEVTSARVLDANKGGLIVKLHNIIGFLPVSQLSPENYPRVSGGDKNKILEKLKEFVGKDMQTRVLDASERDEKLIVSEKAVWEEQQKDVIEKFKVGNEVEGTVTAIADFGVFVKFDNLEGLVHISEIAWQRVEHPKDFVKVGDNVKAEIIGIQGSKIFLSMRKLIKDPWANVGEKYKIGQKVKGKVLKINPFGLFVELDPEIHGLAHISELSDKSIKDMKEVASEGDVLEFTVVSVESAQHRLGLSLKQKKVQKQKESAGEKPPALRAVAAGPPAARRGPEGKEEKKEEEEKETVEKK